MMIYVIGSMISAFLISIVCGIIFIPLLRRLKFGQEIRSEGPKWHKSKSGTPTMGGFIFIIPVIIVTAAVCLLNSVLDFEEDLFVSRIISVPAVSLVFGAIGFFDDYIKVVKKRNLGLTALQKFSLQFIASVIFSVAAVKTGIINTEIVIPFVSAPVNLGFLYIPFIVVVMLACVNSVNLTDGLDGLATSVTIAVLLFFMFVASATKYSDNNILLFTAILIGGLFGFLLYNRYPASVFMGDTGSLFLGGAVSAIAINLKMPVILIIVGFVYVMEALSVIMQVTSFKLTGKRIFKMSPIHHHFEMCGWNERKIVFVFTIAAIVLGLISIFLI